MIPDSLPPEASFARTTFIVRNDLIEARSFHYLLFHFVQPLIQANPRLDQSVRATDYLWTAIEDALIVALGRIYGNPKEFSLRRLMDETINLAEAERRNDEPLTVYRSNAEVYLKGISKIEKRLGFLRNNMGAAHNYERLKRPAIAWKEAVDWLEFAEKVYFEAMSCLGRLAQSGDVTPPSLADQITELLAQFRGR